MLSTTNGIPPRLNDIQRLTQRMQHPYYRNGEHIIAFGKVSDLATPLNLELDTVPHQAEYIMAFAYVPHPSFRDDPENPTLDMGAVLPLDVGDVRALAERVASRLNKNTDVAYKTRNFFFSLRSGEPTFYLDVFDNTRTLKADYGIGGCYPFDMEKLQGLARLIHQ